MELYFDVNGSIAIVIGILVLFFASLIVVEVLKYLNAKQIKEQICAFETVKDENKNAEAVKEEANEAKQPEENAEENAEEKEEKVEEAKTEE